LNGSLVVDRARGFVGTPFVHQGREASGIDCAGLVINCAKYLGLTDFDTRAYKRLPDGRRLLEVCRQNMTEIQLADARPGDVVVFRGRHMKPCHLAILGDLPDGSLSIIHAYYEKGEVVETSFSGHWPERVVGVFRLPGID